MAETATQRSGAEIGSPALIPVREAMAAGQDSVQMQNESGQEVTLPTVEAIFYAKATYPEQCELFNEYIKAKYAPTGKIIDTSLKDILHELYPEIAPDIATEATDGGIKSFIAITAMKKALERKTLDSHPAIAPIVNNIYRGQTTLPVKSLLGRRAIETPISTGIFHIENLTGSEQYALVSMYIDQQLQAGKTPQDIAREVELDLDIDPGRDNLIQFSIKKLDFAIRCEQKARIEKTTKEKITGPNTLGGFLKKLLDQGETHADSRELAMFFERYNWGDYRENPQMISLLEVILSEEFLQEAGEETIKEFAENCIALNPEEAIGELLGIILRFDPIADDPHAPSSILNKIASELRGEDSEAANISPSPARGALPDDEHLPSRTRSRIRLALAAVALVALGIAAGNIDRIKSHFQNTEPTPAGAAASGESQPTRGTLWDASLEEPTTLGQEEDASQGGTLGTTMEDTRRAVEKNTPPNETNAADASAPDASAPGDASAPAVAVPAPDASIPAATTPTPNTTPSIVTADASAPAPNATPSIVTPDASTPPAPVERPAETKPFFLPIVVKTIQFGPKAGQTEIDFNQSKKAWEEAGWKISSIIDMSTRAKTVVLTHQDGRVIKFSEATAVNPGQAELPVHVGR